MTFLIYF
jgi:hypothetical protein